MKIAIEIELGNSAMLTPDDVQEAVTRAMFHSGERDEELELGHSGYIRDRNGNRVGRYDVLAGETAWTNARSSS